MDVRMPDGTLIRDIPDGTPKDEILRKWQALSSQPLATSPSKPYTIGDKVLNSGVGGFVRGLRDPIDAGAQLAVRGLNSLPFVDMNESVKNVEDINRRAEEDYKQNWRQGQDTGMDWGRILGNVLASSVLTRGAGAPQAALQSLPKLAWTGAKQGAGGGALQPVLNADSNLDFWRQKGIQTGVGATTGAVIAPGAAKLLETGGKVVNRGVDAAKGYLTPKTNDEALRRVAEALKAQGIDPAKVSQKTLESLAQDAQEALGKTGVLNPAAVRRAADFREAGITDVPSSWLTRDPVAWTAQENLAGIAGVGERLQRAKTTATNKILGLVDRNRPAGAPADSYALGADAAAGVQKTEKNLKGTVDGLYQLFRDTAPTASGNAARFNDRLAGELEKQMAGGLLPGDFVAKLQAIESGKFPLNVSTMYQLQKAANAQNTDGKNVALTILKNAIDDEFVALAKEGGQSVGMAHDILLAARGMARERFKLQEAVPAFKAAADGVLAPDDFFRKYVAGAKVGELKQMLQQVNDPAALVAMRAQLVDYLKTAAVGTAKEENPTLAQAMFNKALSSTGMRQKLQMLLGDAGLEDVLRAGRLAESVIKAPSGNKVNTSNTSQAVANLATRFMRNTNMGPFATLASDMLAGPVARSAADKAFAPTAGLLAQKSQLATMDPRRARLIGGLLSGPAGSFLSGEYSH